MSGFGGGRLALITGGAGAMGLATATMLAAEGFRIALADLPGERLERAAEAVPGAGAFGFDVSDPDACAAGARAVEEAMGPVDSLVNNAGILTNHKTADTTPDEWRRVMAVNVDGAFFLSRALLPGMKARGFGRVVNTCSLAMKSGGITAGTAYAASKGALQALTFSLAREFVAHGVTVNAVAPAHVRTAMVEQGMTEESRARMLAMIPVGRFCEPEEFAHCVRFFLHPLSGFITGEVLDLNAGLHFD